MKKQSITFLLTLCALCYSNLWGAAEHSTLGFVNFKTCIEKSKQGQHEKNAFEALKKQMSDALEKTDKELDEMAKKLEDQDFMDGLSPTAEQELKQKFQTLSQDYARYENQFYQLLNQANYKMLQTMHDEVSIAAEKVRVDKQLLFLLNEDSTFAYVPSIDYTQPVIEQLDRQFDLENFANAPKE